MIMLSIPCLPYFLSQSHPRVDLNRVLFYKSLERRVPLVQPIANLSAFLPRGIPEKLFR